MVGIRYSIVIPVYNEEEMLQPLWARLAPVLDGLDGPAEVIFVDDCSVDGTRALLGALQRSDSRCRVLRLSRNFGHQIAISAGLDSARGDAVIVMDADLQDPPEVIPQLVEKWNDGFEIVYAVREEREGISWLKRAAYSLFYRLLHRIASLDVPVDAGDFRLVDRRALDVFKRMRERTRYVRGMFSWVGFRQTGVPYTRPGRYAGESKYSFAKLVKLALSGIITFSNVPLRIAIACGALISAGSFILTLWALTAKVAALKFAPQGWTSIMAVVSFLGGVELLLVGVLGLYISNIYEEVKARPLYVLDEEPSLVEAEASQEERAIPAPR